MDRKVYQITFKQTVYHNYRWVASISSISKKDLMDFIDYLYGLKRDIHVFPYIPGGLSAGIIPKPFMDKTYIVKGIAKDIKDKIPVTKMLNVFTRDNNNNDCFNIHFSEDVYEFLLSLGVNETAALEAVTQQWHESTIKRNLMINKFKKNKKLKEFAEWIGDDYLINPYCSRWMFIYMFRTEFKKYMYDKGCVVEVEGGWVLNDKRREMALGLIDDEGNLF